MLEIYNESVRDLLDPKPSKSGLRVRQHPKLGFYGKFCILQCFRYHGVLRIILRYF